MRNRRNHVIADSFRLIAVCAVGAAALRPVQALAAAGGHAEPLPPFSQFLWMLFPSWVNFLLFAGVVFFLVRRPAARAWAGRRRSIEERIMEADSALQASQKRLDHAHNKLSSLRADIEKIQSDIQDEAEAEAARLLAEAKRRAQSIQQHAEEAAAAEYQSAKKAVRDELVALAMNSAAQKLDREITPEYDRALRKSAIGEVGQLVQ